MTPAVVTSWLEVACLALLVGALGVWVGGVVSLPAGLAAAGVACGVASPVLTYLTRPRGSA